MDEKQRSLVAAINLAFSGSEDAKRLAAEAYLSSIRDGDKGWRVATQLLGCCQKEASLSASVLTNVIFWCLHVFESTMRQMSEETASLKPMTAAMLSFVASRTTVDRSAKQKMAQLLASVMRLTYPRKWASFFSDLIAMLSVDTHFSPEIAHTFLLVLKEINVGIQGVEDMGTSMQIKEAMRANDLDAIADTWHSVLCADCGYFIKTLCLQTMASFCEWIPIELMASKRFISLLYSFLEESELRCAATVCLNAIVSKRMAADKKVEMLKDLNVATVALATGSHLLTAAEDLAFVACVASLIEQIGRQLVAALTQGLCEEYATCLNLYDASLLYFRHDDFHVSECVVVFLADYWTLIKTRNVSKARRSSSGSEVEHLSARERRLFQGTLEALALKLRFAECRSEEESEEFAAFREDLGKVLLALNRVAPNRLLLEVGNHFAAICKVIADYHCAHGGVSVASSPTRGGTRSSLSSDCATPEPFPVHWTVIEAALYIVYKAVEEFDRAKPIDEVVKSEGGFQRLVELAVSSGIGNSEEPKLIAQFFDVMGRYWVHFVANDKYLGDVLHSFAFHLQSADCTVRRKAAHRLCHFIKNMSSTRRGRVSLNKYMHRLLPFLKNVILQAVCKGEVHESVDVTVGSISDVCETTGLLILCLRTDDNVKELRAVTALLCRPLADYIATEEAWRADDCRRAQVACHMRSLVKCLQCVLKCLKARHLLKAKESVCSGYVSILKAVNALILDSWTRCPQSEELRKEVICFEHKLQQLLGRRALPHLQRTLTLLLDSRYLTADNLVSALQLVFTVVLNMGIRFGAEDLERVADILSPHFGALMTVSLRLLASLAATGGVGRSQDSALRLDVTRHCLQIVDQMLQCGFHSILFCDEHFGTFRRIVDEMIAVIEMANGLEVAGSSKSAVAQLCKQVFGMFGSIVVGCKSTNSEMLAIFHGALLRSTLVFMVRSPLVCDFTVNVGSYRLMKEVWHLHAAMLRQLSEDATQRAICRWLPGDGDAALVYCRLLKVLKRSREDVGRMKRHVSALRKDS